MCCLTHSLRMQANLSVKAAKKMRQEQQAVMLKQNVMSQMDLQQHMLRPNNLQMNGDLRKQMIQARGMGL